MGSYVTSAFSELEAQLIAGEAIDIVTMQFGDGVWNQGEEPQQLKHMIGEVPVDSVSISSDDPQTVLVVAKVPETLAGKSITEISVVMANGSTAAIANYGNVSIPENASDVVFDNQIDFYFKTSKSENVTIVVSSSSGVTQQELNALLANYATNAFLLSSLEGYVKHGQLVTEIAKHIIYEPLTINVPNDYPTIQAAWDFLKGKVLLADVLISVADGQYNQSILNINDQPYSSRIRIEGNISSPSSCVLNFVADKGVSHGVVFQHVSGVSFSGFRIKGAIDSSNFTHWGLHVDGQSLVYCDEGSIVVDGVFVGVGVFGGSVLFANGMAFHNCGQAAVDVGGSGSVAHVNDSEASGNGSGYIGKMPVHVDQYQTEYKQVGVNCHDSATCYVRRSSMRYFDHGYLVSASAYIYANISDAVDCAVGFKSLFNSTLFCDQEFVDSVLVVARAIGCEIGFIADHTGVINAYGALAQNSSIAGFLAVHFGSISAIDSKANNCATGYRAEVSANILAYNTNANNTSSVPYSPPASDVDGNAGSLIRWS